MKILICLLILLLSACSPVRSGKIVDKIYVAARVETSVQWIEVSDGITVPFTTTTNHPEKFRLKLQTEIDGKVKEGLVDVSSETYHQSQVGELYGVEQQ